MVGPRVLGANSNTKLGVWSVSEFTWGLYPSTPSSGCLGILNTRRMCGEFIECRRVRGLISRGPGGPGG
jgi:hypothetical protein